MFLCCSGRLSAPAVLDQAFRRPGSVLLRLGAPGPTDASRRRAFLCASAARRFATPTREPARNLDAAARSAITTGGVWKGSGSFAGSSSAQTRTAATDRSSRADPQEASSTSNTEKDPGNTQEPEEGKPTKTQQLKKVFKEYGAVGVSFHIGISLMSLGMFYLLISSGIDMAALLCKLGFSEQLVRSKMAAGTSTFVLAYAVHKLFAPVRISITVVSVPLVVRYFRKTGLFKPPTHAP